MEKKIPNKLFFKIGEVCELTETQPYVLRYWESEFPALAPAKNNSGQRIYRRRDIETILRIKSLLYEEGFTIAGAKKKLEQEMKDEGAKGQAPVTRPIASDGDPATGLQQIKEELRDILEILDSNDSKLTKLGG
ncbi:MAG: MerR family transcriptional regulator [Vicinamibacteria bacterium]